MNVVLILAFLKAVTPTRRFKGNSENPRRIEEYINFGPANENNDDIKQREIDEGTIDKKEVDEIDEFLRKAGDRQVGKTQPRRKKVPYRFLSPRDELSYDERRNITDQIGNRKRKDDYIKSIVRPVGFDFSSILDRNIENPPVKTAPKDFKIQDTTEQPKRAFPTGVSGRYNITTFFEDNTFLRRRNATAAHLWTTCDEFAKKAVFHPDDIVNTQWMPFYVWSRRMTTKPIIHTFSYPTKKTVQHYKTTYGPYLENINWNRAKLLFKNDRQALLVAKDGRGLFTGIPDQALPPSFIKSNATLPTMTIRLKIHDPYLAMMYCEEFYAVIMAELGTQPTSVHEAEQEANTLQFRGKGTPVFKNREEENKFFRDIEADKKLEAQNVNLKKKTKSSGAVDGLVDQ